VRELNQRLDSRELNEWAAWEGLYGPLGPERQDRLNAILCSVIANANRGRGRRPYKPDEFHPTEWLQSSKPDAADGTGRTELTGEELLAKVKGYNKAMGGR
jgi:hypothetical protein